MSTAAELPCMSREEWVAAFLAYVESHEPSSSESTALVSVAQALFNRLGQFEPNLVAEAGGTSCRLARRLGLPTKRAELRDLLPPRSIPEFVDQPDL